MPRIIKNAFNEPRTQKCPSCGSIWELDLHEWELEECPVCGAGIEVRDPKLLDPKTRTIDAIIADFDFEKVHEVMNYLNWTWWGDQCAPSVETIKKEARHLLESAWDNHCSTGSGGLWVEYENENDEEYPMLKLSFELTWSGPCWISKQDNQMQYA